MGEYQVQVTHETNKNPPERDDRKKAAEKERRDNQLDQINSFTSKTSRVST